MFFRVSPEERLKAGDLLWTRRFQVRVIVGHGISLLGAGREKRQGATLSHVIRALCGDESHKLVLLNSFKRSSSVGCTDNYSLLDLCYVMHRADVESRF
jgi:hypothetical protein